MEATLRMPLTRRDLLHRIAAVGGASLAYEAMTGLGLLEAQTGGRRSTFGARLTACASRHRRRARRPHRSPTNSASSATRFRCSRRAQGRAGAHTPSAAAPSAKRTVRRRRARSTRGCTSTAARCASPYHHTTRSRYCRELQVPVEIFPVTSDSRVSLSAEGGRADRPARPAARRARGSDGYVAELLSKAVSTRRSTRPSPRTIANGCSSICAAQAPSTPSCATAGPPCAGRTCRRPRMARRPYTPLA